MESNSVFHKSDCSCDNRWHKRGEITLPFLPEVLFAEISDANKVAKYAKVHSAKDI